MRPDDWIVLGDRLALLACLVAVVLYSCGVIG